MRLDLGHMRHYKLKVRTELARSREQGFARHEDSGEDVEEQGKHVQGTREECADSGAESQQTGEERADCKEEADESKGEHESGQQEELPRSNELLRNAFRGTECSSTGWVKRVSWMNSIA